MKRLLVLGLFVVVTSGCASVRSLIPGQSPNSAGDQLFGQAKDTNTWNDGQKLVTQGEKLLSRSEELARESRDAKLEAEGLIAKGNTLISNSESGYRVASGEGLSDPTVRKSPESSWR